MKEYTLQHIPEEHRLRAYKELEKTLKDLTTSPHWRKLQEAKLENFANSHSFYTGETEYKKQVVLIKTAKKKMEAFILAHPEYTI